MNKFLELFRFVIMLLGLSFSTKMIQAFPIEATATQGKCYVCHARPASEQPLVGQGGWMDGRPIDGLIDLGDIDVIADYAVSIDELGDTIAVESAPYLQSTLEGNVTIPVKADVLDSFHALQISVINDRALKAQENDVFDYTVSPGGLNWTSFETAEEYNYFTTDTIRSGANHDLDVSIELPSTIPFDMYLVRIAVAGKDSLSSIFYDEEYLYIGANIPALETFFSDTILLGDGYFETKELGDINILYWPWIYQNDLGWFLIDESSASSESFWVYVISPEVINAALNLIDGNWYQAFNVWAYIPEQGDLSSGFWMSLSY